MLGETEVLALKVVTRQVSQVRRDIGGIERDLQRLRAENARVLNQQRSMMNSNRSFGLTLRNNLDPGVRGMRQLGEEGKRTQSVFSKMSGTVTGLTVAAGAFYGAARFGLEAIEKLESRSGFFRSLKFNYDLKQATQLKGQVSAYAMKQGLDVMGLRGTVAGMAGTGRVTSEEMIPLIRAFSALGASGGASGTQISRAFEQFSQIASQGQLQGDELRQINENLVPLRRLLMESGLGPRIGSQTQPITFEEIKKVLLDFGKRPDVDKMLKEQSEQASASLARLGNVVNEQLLPAVGEGLTPVVVELSEEIQEWTKNLDPDAIRQTTETWVRFGKGVAEHAPEIIGLFVAWKAFRAVQMVRLTISANRAAASLERLAVAGGMAGGGGVGGGFLGGGPAPSVGGGTGGGGYGPGFYMQGQGAQTAQRVAAARRAAGSTRSFWGPLAGPMGRLGRRFPGARGAMMRGLPLAGGLGGSLVGDAVVGQFTDNEWARLGGSVAGWYGGQKLATSLAGKMAGGARLAGGAAAVDAGLIAALGTLALGTVIAGIEAGTGVAGTEESVFTNMFLGGGGYQDMPGTPGRSAWTERKRKIDEAQQNAQKSFYARIALRKAMQRRWGWTRVPTLQEIAFIMDPKRSLGEKNEFFAQANGGRAYPLEPKSPRTAAMDSRAAESEARSIIWSQ